MKILKIFLLLLALITLTTYNSGEFNSHLAKKKIFFKIKNIYIVNNDLVNKSAIDSKLSEIYDKNIFFLKKKEIQESLSSINFLERIEVKKNYPNSITIKIFETKPLAIFFKKDKKYLLDSASKLISYKENLMMKDLPIVFGEDGEKFFIDFLKLLKDNNFPVQQIKNFYYFQIGRWDIQLLNNQLIKLPSNNTVEAIQQIVELINRIEFEKYNVIDLRIDDKIIVE